MLIVALALVVVAATAAVVIRDAHPRPPKAVADVPEAAPEAVAQPLVLDVPQPIEEEEAPYDPDLDAPTQSMPAPVAFAGGQAAALRPYAPIPAAAPEPEPVQAAAFVPAGTPYLQPDPDRLIQTEIVIEDPAREQSAALTKLALGMAISGTAIGLVIVGAGRGIGALIHLLLH